MRHDDIVSVRYMVDDVDASIDFYTEHFGFQTGWNASPAFAEVIRGNLRLLLAGPKSSAGRPMVSAYPLDPALEIDIGTGATWLEAK